MNKIDFTKNGGLPVTQYTFDFMQQNFLAAFMGMAAFIGEKAIISGVVQQGGQHTNGWVVLNGELLPFVGGVTASNVDIIETKQQRTYDDGNDKDVYYERRVQFVNSGGVLFSDFIRADNTLINSLVPKGLISMWSGAINAIPMGWALCNGQSGTPNLSGKFIVGYDAGDLDYNAIGNPGGEKTHLLSVGELPAHTHNYNRVRTDLVGAPIEGNTLKNGSDRGLHAGDLIASSSVGGNEPHENRPPYYTLAYIIKL